MVLRWLHDGDVVDGSTMMPPKPLELEASDLDARPVNFRIFKVYSPVEALIRRYLGVPERRHMVTMNAEKSKQGNKVLYRSDKSWQLPVPVGVHASAQFLFATDAGDESGRIRSSRFGEVRIGGRVGAALVDPTGGGNIPLGLDGRLELKAAFTPSVDPFVRIEVLTGQRLVDYLLKNAISELNDQGIDLSQKAQELDAVRRDLLRSYDVDEAWSYSLDPETIDVAEDSTTEVTLTLSIPASSSGRGGFAFSFVDTSRPDDPDGGIVSDVVAVRMFAGQAVVSSTYVDVDTD